MNLSEAILGKWTLQDDTPDMGMEYFGDGRFVHKDGRNGVYRFSPKEELEWTWIYDGEQLPYDGTKWKVEIGSDSSGIRTMKLTNTETGYTMDFLEGR